MFRSVRANGNLCFLDQEASSSFQKAKKEKKNHPDGTCVSHSVTLTVLSSVPPPPCKTTTTNAQILGELEVMTLNFPLKMKNVDYDLTHFIYVCSSL